MSESNEEVYTIPDYMRMHPSMCYGKLGDGTGYFDCIYLMLQAIIDNSIDEFKMGFGDRIEVAVDYATGEMCVRDYGRGAPVEKLDDCFIAHDGGGMYSADFTMNHAVPWASAMKVSALSEGFLVQSVCTGKYGRLVVRHGKKVSYDIVECGADEKNGMLVRWTPDATVLPAFTIVEEHVVLRIKECAAANPGLKFFLNGQEITAV
jgi:topoisomerase-4 subunit B